MHKEKIVIKRLLKYYFTSFVAILLSFLSLFSETTKPNKGDLFTISYCYELFKFYLFEYRLEIGIFALVLVLLNAIIVTACYQPKHETIEKLCDHIRKNIHMAIEDEIQVSYFVKQSGLRMLFVYLKNLFIVIFHCHYWKNHLILIFIKDKFPNVRKAYYRKMEQSFSHSYSRPTLYFQESYDNENTNGFVSYYLTHYGQDRVNIEPIIEFSPSKERSAYTGNQLKRFNKYLREMKLSEQELRCMNRAANFIHVIPINNRENEVIGALVIDILHSTKIKVSEEYNDFITNQAKVIQIVENYIK